MCTDGNSPTDDATRHLYRGMRAGPDRLPVVARSGRTLGIRVPVDVQPDAHGRVHPTKGGMSVAPDDPRHLPPHRRPRLFGGVGPDPVFELATDALPASLVVHRASPRHAVVAPGDVLPLMVYEAALHGTRPDWRLVDDPS